MCDVRGPRTCGNVTALSASFYHTQNVRLEQHSLSVPRRAGTSARSRPAVTLFVLPSVEFEQCSACVVRASALVSRGQDDTRNVLKFYNDSEKVKASVETSSTDRL